MATYFPPSGVVKSILFAKQDFTLLIKGKLDRTVEFEFGFYSLTLLAINSLHMKYRGVLKNNPQSTKVPYQYPKPDAGLTFGGPN